jgi:hypothetical protein
LTRAEIAEREHRARDVALAVNIAYKDDNMTPPGSPPAAGESPYRTTITLPTRLSPRRAPQATQFFSRDGTPEAPPGLPPSTAPPRLEEQAQGVYFVYLSSELIVIDTQTVDGTGVL